MSPTLMELTEKDRAFVVDRLDRDHIEELARSIRQALAQGSAVEACYQPGDGTWYALVFAQTVLLGASGGGTKGFSPSTQIGPNRTFVAYIQEGTMSDFGPNDSMEWIASKLTDNGVSAAAIAELLKAVTGAEH